MKKLLFFLSLSAMLFGFSSCESDQVEHSLEFYTAEEFSTLRQNLNLPSIPHEYQQFFFGGPNANNVNDIATLGRVLFYDKQL